MGYGVALRGMTLVSGVWRSFDSMALLSGVLHSQVVSACLQLHGNAVEWYYSRIVPCMENGTKDKYYSMLKKYNLRLIIQRIVDGDILSWA